jgi:hypothetical protein
MHLNKTKRYISTNLIRGTSLLLILFIYGCQDVITLDLNNSPSKLVVEGYISNLPGPYSIKLSQSSNYFDPNIPNPEKGATVILSDNAGNSETLKETSPGIYSTTTLQGTSNRTYQLSIVTKDKVSYTASSFLPPTVKIDSLQEELRKRNGVFGSKGPPTYRVKCYFTDPFGLGNYYRIRFYKNDSLQNGDFDYVIASDQLANGQSNTPQLADGLSNFIYLRGRYFLKDSVKVELLAIDKKGFEFYSDLQKLLRDKNTPFPTDAPSNPINNISNGALGYFGAYAISTKKISIH